ncbi:hypothetical protein SAMN06295974_3738 [Plantibacter flavus]|uniref:Uncharacterized protein n=1 Tax=Plantibacter flavus TaxID=150123 RepID=A0A3N2BM46_9MICO|nr:hypothetical protein [Plantibacter flavus]ROR76114.1 hypothetical protein EDD42_4067 [Plantibacter flavus]SMG48447.1 hypothetical protein SAMN06295974_3738 [Plantibacter flavus]
MAKATADMIEISDVNALGATRTAKSVLGDKKGLSTSIPEALGAIVLGMILLGGAAFGVGAAINYGQDSGAESDLESVKAAQTLYQAKNATYGTKAQLTSGSDPAMANSDKGSWDVAVTANNFCAISKSKGVSGTTYWITAKTGKAVTTMPTAAEAGVACPTIPAKP